MHFKNINLQWSRNLFSELQIFFHQGVVNLKCITKRLREGQNIETTIDKDAMIYLIAFSKKFYLNNIKMVEEIQTNLKITDDGKFLQIRPQTLKGGGCGTSHSLIVNNESIQVQKHLKVAQNRNKSSAASTLKGDIQILTEELNKVINFPDDEIYNGKSYLLDNIFPLVDKFGVISNRVLHPLLLKVLMKALNLLLKVNTSSSDENSEEIDEGKAQEGGLIWTEKDKKRIEEALSNILERIKSRERQEPLLLHCYCTALIRDMLKTNKNSYDPIAVAVKIGVPLFGLIRNQDPTLLLMIAVKAVQLYMEKQTKDLIQQMIGYQTKVLQLLNKQEEKHSKNVRLLFAYHEALDGIIGKKSGDWELQVFAMIQINEVLKQMINEHEEIDEANDKWNKFFQHPERGLFSICKQKSSLSGMIIGDLIDTYILNHKTVRFIALEILTNAFFLLKQQKQKSNIIDQVVDLLFERWLLENSMQVRPLFVNEEILIVLNEQITKKQQEQIVVPSKRKQNQQQASRKCAKEQIENEEEQNENEEEQNQNEEEQNENEEEQNENEDRFEDEDDELTTNELSQTIKQEQQALQQIKQKLNSSNKELNSEFQGVEDTLLKLSSPEGLKSLIHKRQMESWKESILSRRQRGEMQKDDAILDSISTYIPQRMKTKMFEVRSQEDSADEELEEEALDYIKNSFIGKKQTQTKQKMCVIFGRGGTGKSMLLKKLEMELLDDFALGNDVSKYDTLPVVIKMVDLDPLEPNIIEYLQQQEMFKEQRLEPEVLRDSTQKKLILFDAFDEFRGVKMNLWSKLNLGLWKNTQVLVTSREDGMSTSVANFIFARQLSESEKQSQKGSFSSHSYEMRELMGFEQSQLEIFADQMLKEKSDKDIFKDILYNSSDLARLLSLPINAFIFLKTLPSVTKSGPSLSTIEGLSNQTEIQELFCSHSFEREALMLPKSDKDKSLLLLYKEEFFSLFQRIAINMFAQRTFKLSLDDYQKSKVPTSFKPALKKQLSGAEISQLQYILRNYSNSTIIVTDYETQTIKFSHNSLLEFFAARAIVSEIMAIPPKSLHQRSIQELKSLSISQRYIVERGDSSGLAVLQSVAKMIKPLVFSANFIRSLQHNSLQQHDNLIQLILLSRKAHFGSQLDIPASNMLSALARTKTTLKNLNLNKCSVSKAYLYNYHGQADLTSSDLNDAMILGCGLDISRSKTENAQLFDAQVHWSSSNIFSFSSCVVIPSKKGSLTIFAGSLTGHFNSFEVEERVENNSQPGGSKDFINDFNFKLKISKRLFNNSLKNLKLFGNQFVLTLKNNVIVLDANGNEIVVFQAHQNSITSLDVNSDLKHIVTVERQSQSIKVWSLNGQQYSSIQVLEDIHTKTINSVKFGVQQSLLVSASDDKTCGVWKFSKEKNEYSLLYFIKKFDSGVKHLAFSNQLLVTCTTSFSGFALWKLNEDKEEIVKKLNVTAPFCTQIEISPNGQHLAVIVTGGIYVYKFKDNDFEEITKLEKHKSPALSASFSADSTYLVTSGRDFSCIIYNVEQQFKDVSIIAAHREHINSVAISPKNEVMVSISATGCFIWKERSNQYQLQGKVVDQETQDYQFESSSFYQGKDLLLALSSKNSPEVIVYKITITSQALEVVLLQKISLQSKALSLQFHQDLLFIAFSKGGSLFNPQDSFSTTISAFTQSKFEIESAAIINKGEVFYFIFLLKGNSIEVYEAELDGRPEIFKKISLGDESMSTLCSSASPDGKYLAVVSSDSQCRVYSIEKDYALVQTLRSQSKETIQSAVFSSDSTRLCTTSAEKSVRIWSSSSNFEQEKSISEDVSIADLILGTPSFLPSDSKKLISPKDANIIIWDFQQAYFIDSSSKRYEGAIICVSSSPSGSRLATYSSDNIIKVWVNSKNNFDLLSTVSTNQGKKLYYVSSISFLSEFAFVCGCLDNNLRVFTISGQMISQTQLISGHSNKILDVHSTFQNISKYFASGSEDSSCKIWISQPSNGEKRSQLSQYQEHKILQESPPSPIRSVCFARNGLLFAIGSNTGTITLFDCTDSGNIGASFSLLFTLKDVSSFITRLRFSKDSKYLASGYLLKACNVWDIQSKQNQQLSNILKDVTSLDFGSNNELVVSTTDSSLQVFQLINNKYELSHINSRAHLDVVFQVTFCGQNGLLASVSKDKTCKIWSTSNLLSTNLNHSIVSPHSKPITYLAVSEDSTFIAAASLDKQVSIYKQSKNRLEHLQTIQTPAVAIRFVGCATDENIKLITVSEDKFVKMFNFQQNTFIENSKIKLSSKPNLLNAFQSSNNQFALILHTEACSVFSISTNLSLQQSINDVKLANVNSQSTLFAFLKQDLKILLQDKSFNTIHKYQLSSPQPHQILFSQDNSFLAVFNSLAKASLYSTSSPFAEVSSQFTYPIETLAFSPKAGTNFEILSLQLDSFQQLRETDMIGISEENICTFIRGRASNSFAISGNNQILSVFTPNGLSEMQTL